MGFVLFHMWHKPHSIRIPFKCPSIGSLLFLFFAEMRIINSHKLWQGVAKSIRKFSSNEKFAKKKAPSKMRHTQTNGKYL